MRLYRSCASLKCGKNFALNLFYMPPDAGANVARFYVASIGIWAANIIEFDAASECVQNEVFDNVTAL